VSEGFPHRRRVAGASTRSVHVISTVVNHLPGWRQIDRAAVEDLRHMNHEYSSG